MNEWPIYLNSDQFNEKNKAHKPSKKINKNVINDKN